jgi:hypothetical protein
MLLLLAWAWRHKARRPFVRLLLPLALSIVCLFGFAVAGIFSALISSAIGDEVLLLGNNCSQLGFAPWQAFGNMSWEDYSLPIMTQAAQEMQNAANYVLQCYSQTTSKGLGCNTYVRSHLPHTINMNAPCPFDEKICKSKDRNLLLDTGYLDSHSDFGINAPIKERFLYRRVMQCAPLVTEGYKRHVNISRQQSVTTYHYSQISQLRNTTVTYQYSNDIAADPLNQQYRLGYFMPSN